MLFKGQYPGITLLHRIAAENLGKKLFGFEGGRVCNLNHPHPLTPLARVGVSSDFQMEPHIFYSRIVFSDQK